MTTPELIDFFLLPACFRSPLGDQLGHQITACCSLPKSPPKAFKRGEAGFPQQPVVLDADAEDVALAQAKRSHTKWQQFREMAGIRYPAGYRYSTTNSMSKPSCQPFPSASLSYRRIAPTGLKPAFS